VFLKRDKPCRHGLPKKRPNDGANVLGSEAVNRHISLRNPPVSIGDKINECV